MTPEHQAALSQRLRDRRSGLRQELSAIGHWRRLLRAKIDLTVARGAGPAPLEPSLIGENPALRTLNSQLRELTEVDDEHFRFHHLPTLRELDKTLVGYEASVRRELMAVTDMLVEHLADRGLTEQVM